MFVCHSEYFVFKTFSASRHTQQYQFWITCDTSATYESAVAFLPHLIELKGHFRSWVLSSLCFTTSLSAKPLIWRRVLMQFHFHANQSHFHKNDFALQLAFKQRHKGTRKWPIRQGKNANYFIHTEIFASNFALWKSVPDFTSTNQRGETSFSHVKRLFCPITNQLKPWFKWIVFSRAFSRSSRVTLSGSFDKILYFRCTRVVRNSNFQVIKS